MPTFKVTLSDTITIARFTTIEIEAEDENEAIEAGHSVAQAFRFDGKPLEMDEDQIDNTPWEVDVEEVER